jgi:predicted nucleotidyltransferase
MNALIEQKMPQIVELCRKYHVDKLYLFGSATTDKFTPESDFDFVYLFEKDIPAEYDYANNLLDFFDELKTLMGREIDMVGEKFMKNPYFIKSVEHSKKMLYAA